MNQILYSGDKDQQTNLNENVIVDVEQLKKSVPIHIDKLRPQVNRKNINMHETKHPIQDRKHSHL